MTRKIMVMAAVCCACGIAAGCGTLKAPRGATEGEKIVRQLWSDIKAKNWAPIEAMMSPGFQSVHQDGARDRVGEMELLKGLDIGRLSLGAFASSAIGPVLVVTYEITAVETIGGKRLPRRTSPRMSVFLQKEGRWLWIAHANMVPLKE